MVAVVSGNGLGLGNTSLNTLGSQGAVGNASEGQAGEQVYVNSSTGNLVIQDQDDYLAALGLDLPAVRTYNSQGLLTDDLGGNWRMGVNERLLNLTGTVNTAGSTIVKVFGDESEIIYAYNAAQGKYIATGQAGAHDQLTYNASNQTWTWVSGSSGAAETYDSTGRLQSARDTAGNQRTYSYTGSLLTQVTDASGQTTHFDYTGSNLTQIWVVSQGQTQTLTHYVYDSQNRLSQVKVDLSPQDSSITDGNVYITTYAYDGASNRIVSITRGDGTTVSFSYELAGGVYRVKTYTDGDRRVVTASANAAALQTTQTQTTTNTYNVNTSALTPPHWSSEVPFDNTSNVEFIDNAVFNSNGDGFVAFIAGPPPYNYTNLYVSKYSAATQTWSAPTLLDVPAGASLGGGSVAIDQQGNAAVVWATSNSTAATTNFYGSVYNKANNTWSSRQTIATGLAWGAAEMHVSVNGTRAVVSFGIQHDNTNNGGMVPYDFYVARMNNGVWGGPELVQSSITTYWNDSRSDAVGIDAQGNVTVLWTDANASTSSLYSKRWTAASGSWSAVQTLDTIPDGAVGYPRDAINQVQFLFDINGNGFALWRRGIDSGYVTTVTDQILAARWDRASGTWGSSILMDTATNKDQFGGGPSLKTDLQGNVLAAWANAPAVYANLFSAATQTWSGRVQITSNNGDSPPVTSINGGQAAVLTTGWLTRYVNGVWQAPQSTGLDGVFAGSEPSFIDLQPSGDIEALGMNWDYYGRGGWVLLRTHYTSQYSYTVPAGATWASIGQALYGSADVGSQLQSTMGNPTLTTGLVLVNLPSSINVTSTVVVSVPPYYTVVAADSWATIAQKVYGTTDPAAASALQTALGNPALTAGVHLTVPASLSYTLTVGDQATTLTYTTSSGTSSPVTASANTNALTTTSTSNQTYNVNSGALSTTDTVNQPYSLNTSALSGSSGTINFVQGNFSAVQWSAVDTVTVPFTSAQTAGDLNVIAIGWTDATATLTSVTDSMGNVYTRAVGPTSTAENGSLVIYYAKNIAAAAANANTITLRFSGPVTWPDIRAAEYHGADLTNPLDGAVGASGNSLNLDSGTLTTTNASDLLIGASYVENELTGPGDQFTQREMSDGGEILEDRAVSSTGSYDATAPQDSSGWWIMQLAAFKAASSTGTYYVVPSGATWQSIANVLYGVNSAAAGTALQTAMGNPALTAGAHLTGLPATLTVPTVETVPAYYTIGSGATWQSIASALYGVNSAAAGAALQTAMGNPALTAGNRLTSLPSTLTVSTTVTVPAYYAVPAGATWASITLAIYGTNDSNAVLALQAATGVPTLSTGLHLTVPATLSYVPATSSVSAPANSATLLTTDTVNQPYSLNTGALSGGGSGAIDFVQGNYADPQWASVDTVTVPFTSAQTAGDLNAVAIAFNDSTSTITSVTDSLGNVYTLAAAPTKMDGNGTQAIYYAKNIAAAAAGANTLTVTFSNPVMWADVRAAEYHGADLTNPLDGIVGATGYSANMDSGALTTTNASDLLIGASYVANHTTGPGDQFNQRLLNENGNILEDRTVTSTGSYDATAPLDSAGWWIMQLAAFKAASSTGTYYVVPSGATWQSIANALYGVNSAAAGTALQTAMGNPALTAGAHLTGLPATLTVPTVQTVPAYYTVPAGATWASIAQAVYGATDANAITALQVATGNPALTTGSHLAVPLTLTYSPAGSVAQLQTDITDALGKTTTYFADSSGRLTSMLSPTMGGARLRTDFTYDTNGNITSVAQDPSGLNRVTTLTYDTNGNLFSTRDALGDTVTRTYSSTNKVLTETHYLTPDPDGAGSAQPANPVTTRYAYDSEDHLRFSVSSDGRVIEYRYNSLGQQTAELRYTDAEYSLSSLAPTDTLSESQLTTWAAARNLLLVQRTDYVYDPRGNISTSTVYGSTDGSGAGVAASGSVTHYIYDQRGHLLQEIDPRAASTSASGAYTTTYVYDGLGRVTSTTQWIDGSTSSTVLTNYDTANNRTVTTLANGLVSTSVYDHAGRLISVTQSNASGQSLGTTTYSYDADGRLRMTTDATGVRQYIIYDESGREVADIDGMGTLTQYVYNAANQVVKTISYADALSSAQLATLLDNQGNPANVSVASLVTNLPTTVGRASDQITRDVYDQAGRKQYDIDAVGDVTQYFYDGENRVTDEVQYATPITIAASVAEVLPSAVSVSSSPSDRHSRNFYDNDGHLTGTLDAAGYLVEYTYDSAGQLVKQTGYATPTSSSIRSTGTLAQLRPAPANTPPNQDITSYFFYDGEGRRTGVLDGEGYLTETVYDLEGNVSQEIRYDSVRTYSAGATVASLRPSGVTTHTTSYQYDGANRVVQKTNYEGTVETDAYDRVGNLISTTTAAGTSDARTTQERYDSLGHLTATLTAQGSSLITAVMTQAQIDAIWNQYAVHYSYDLLGRRISSTDQKNNTTLYFYDVDGRLTYTVNALGEVAESRYNALGQLTDTIAYANRISTASLVGGTVSAALVSRVTAIADATKDARTSLTYKLSGRLAGRTTATGASTTYTYDAFGDESSSVEKIDATRSTTHNYNYDARGLLISTTWDAGGLNTSESDKYDAFGRLTDVTDANGNTTHTDYDRLGRQVATVDALGGRQITVYDGFSRTKTTQDALGNTTTYSYNDATRSIVTTTPEGVSVTTVHNREGQALSVTAAGLTTTYGYDANGQLQSVSDDLGSLESRTYDAAGRQLTDTDALGTVTTFTYDAANRVLTKTVDSGTGGLGLVTTYIYDAEGRTIRVIDPKGKVTDTLYDQDGHVLQIDEDPTGLDLRTTHTYDAAGDVLTVIQGAGSANPLRTQYIYDNLGRRIQEIVDPTALGGTLNIVTQYKYDANGNLTRKIDTKSNSTWYVYDVSNRLRYTIDALGGVTETTYDADNRVLTTHRYASPISTSGLGNVVTAVSVTASPSRDRVTQSVYDRDGRNVYSIDATGAVTERQFDADGRVTRERTYSDSIAAGTYTSVASVRTALLAVRANVDAIGSADRVTWRAYDLRGNAAFTVDAVGNVVQNSFDAAGNVIATTAYATRNSSGSYDLASLKTWVTSNGNSSKDRATRYWYDSTGRLRFRLDALGYLQETRYNDVARTQTAINYTEPALIAAGASLAAVVSVAQALEGARAGQSTITNYDLLGRVASITDAAGGIQRYGYDALGNKTSYTNQNGATWNYTYDAAGRLRHKIDPAVDVTTVAATTTSLTPTTTAGVRLDTAYTYDALGNLLSRTEASGTNWAVTTSYEYDALGHQTRTILPAVGVYNAAADDPTRSGTAVVRTDTAADQNNPNLYTEVSYDALGNAYRSRDVSGNYSFKIYDSMGRVLYDVDADNFVTSYGYDSFGNQTSITRYATPLSSPLPTNTSSVVVGDITSRLVNSSLDRTITTTYDSLNRVIQVTQPSAFNFEPGSAGTDYQFFAAATAVTEYDAFGEVIRSRQLVNPITSTYADTYYYYDNVGNKTAEIDPLGFITKYTYDGVGNVYSKYEYAKALAAGIWNTSTFGTPVVTTVFSSKNDSAGYDRETIYSYNQLHQKTSEILQNLDYFSYQEVLTEVTANRETDYYYDAVGNLTGQTTAGVSTYTYYDALGRVIAVAAPRRFIDGSSNSTGTTSVVAFTPLTEIRRDVFGNVVEQIEHATDAGVIDSNFSSRPVVGSSPNDRITVIARDQLGRAIQTQDAMGAQSFASYNARGDIAKQWQYVTNNDGVTEALVTIHDYDKRGNETSVTQPQVSGSVVVRTGATYDSFGEIASKAVYTNGVVTGLQETFEYDHAGRLWRTNSGDGVLKVYAYNLAGQATAEIHGQTAAVASALAGAADANAANGLSGTMRTVTVYDLKGQAVQQRKPQFVVTNTQDLIDARPSISTMTTAVPPQAVYRAVTTYGDRPYYDPDTTVYYLDPASWDDGGGYIQVQIPVAGNPDGVYTRVDQASYSLVQAKQLHWAAPSALDVVATFQYWPLSNPSAVNTLPVYSVSVTQIGANISSLASGQYGYTISYSHAGATTAFATQRGTFDSGSGAVTVVATGSGSSQLATPTTTQSFDRWGNAITVQDAGGGITQYRYNQLGQLTLTLLPTAEVVDTRSGVDTRVEQAGTSNYYDLQGNLIETHDGNGSATIKGYNAAGQVLWRSYGGGTTQSVYNAFGDLIQVTDELGYKTRNTYDKDDRLTQVAQEDWSGSFASSDPADSTASSTGRVIYQSYSYDQAGRRLSQTDGAGHTTRDWYDLQGNILREQTPLGFNTVYQYDGRGNKIRQTDGDGSYQTWSYDSLGRLMGHTDLTNTGAYGSNGGTSYTYGYDAAGEMTSQTNTLGQSLTYGYDGGGHLTSIADSGTAAFGSNAVNASSSSTFVYDAAGRQVRDTEYVDGRKMADTRIGYDALGRIQTLDDPNYRVSYSYDGAGDRTVIKTTYLDHSAILQDQDLYYRYNSRNEAIISQGVLTTGSVPDITINANQGQILTYDAKGERTSVRTAGTHFLYTENVTNGNVSSTTIDEVTAPDGLATTNYSYDGLGRLTGVALETDHVFHDTTTGVDTHSAITLTTDVRTYDNASRLDYEINYLDENHQLSHQEVTSAYDDDGRTTSQTTKKNGLMESVVTFGSATLQGNGTWTRGYDAADVLRGYAVDVYSDGTYKYTTNYTSTYRLGSTYLETGQSATSTGTNAPQQGSTTRTYNVDNALTEFKDNAPTAADKTRYFANSASGHVLTTIEGNFDGVGGDMSLNDAWEGAVSRNIWVGSYNVPKAQYFFYADGNAIGSFGQLQSTDGSFKANFDVNYTPISSHYPASAPSQVVVQAGDTLRTIAARVYGDASLWYVIAEKNGLTDPDAQQTAGTTLTIPNDVVSLSNTSSSFKPFDASQAIGDTTPTQPAPPAPQQGGCGVFGQILEIAIAIVVTYFTAGALSGLGPVLAGAIGGAAGSVASQAVAIADGDQKGFNWKGVAIGALGGAVGGELDKVGFGKALAGAIVPKEAIEYGALAINAAAGSIVTQEVGVVTGLQDKFSWTAVATAAVAAPLARLATNELNINPDRSLNTIGQNVEGALASAAASGLGSIGVQLALDGRVQTTGVLADAFGHALGDSLTGIDAAAPTQSFGVSDEQFADLNRQLSKQVADAEAEVDASVASRNQAYANQRQQMYANQRGFVADADQAVELSASGLNASLARSIRAATRMPQINFPAEEVDPVTAAEYAARNGQTDFMAEQPAAIANAAARLAAEQGQPTGTIGPDQGLATHLFYIGKAWVNGNLSAGDAISMALDNTAYAYRNSETAQGVVQISGGVGEVAGAVGITAASGGPGAVVGVPLAFHGGDNIGTGINRILYQESQNTLTYNTVDAITGSPTAAHAIDTGIPLLGGVVGAAGAVDALSSTVAFNKATAFDFYTKEAGFTESRALQHMEGIDFSQPVDVMTLDEGTNLQQYVRPSGPGNYFAPIGTTPLESGLTVTDQALSIFKNTEPVTALKSFAAPGYLYPPGAVVPGSGAGGGLQYFIPNKGAFIPRSN